MARRRNEAAAAADYAFAKMRGEITGAYAQAESELAEKLRKFTRQFEAQDIQKRAALAAGEITKEQYASWLRGQVFRGDRWKAVRQSCVDQIHRANETVTRRINGERRAVFQNSANYSAYQIERGTQGAISFSLYDSAAVTRLLEHNKKMLPDLKIGKRRDDSWNGRGIQNAITQGIIQGEGIPDIAKRIAQQTGERNRAALTRQARTSMTGAQNMGRLAAMEDAKEKGIRVQKKWIATLDKKTRDAHAELDGQVVDADQPFVVNGMEIMCPGDPNADPSLVYNCRCTLGWVYPDHPAAAGARRDNKTGEVIGGVSYREWEQGMKEPAVTLEAEAQAAQSAAPSRFAAYRPDQYDDEYKRLLERREQLGNEGWKISRDRSIPYAERLQRVNDIAEEQRRIDEQIYSSYAPEALASDAQKRGVEYNPLVERTTPFDDAAVIKHLGGGDLTEGSCASLASAYVGQMAGYDVLDFRDGHSRELFSHFSKSIAQIMVQTEGGVTEAAKNYKTAGKRCLAKAEEGKTYYFSCGRHAAIVRKLGGDLQYLELQSSSDNGWKSFSTYGIDRTLTWRFGADLRAGGLDVYAHMVDAEMLSRSDRFLKNLGYLNTAESEQKKGAGGHER